MLSTGKPVKIDSSFIDQSKAKSGSPVSAIVEIDLPFPQVEVANSRLDYSGGAAMKRIKSVTPAVEQSERLEEAEVLIRSLVEREPVLLRSAGSFVIDLTVQQAEALSHSPLVRRIYGNLPLRG